MRWHLAAVQACTSFSIITEKREAQAALEGDGRTDGCPLLSARSTGSLLQPPGDRDLPEITARKTELWTAPVQAIGSLFSAPKSSSQHHFRANSPDADVISARNFLCLTQGLCTNTIPTDALPDFREQEEHFLAMWVQHTSFAWSFWHLFPQLTPPAPLLQCHSWHRGFSSSIPAPSSGTMATALSRQCWVHSFTARQWFLAPKTIFVCNHTLSAPLLNPLFPIFPRTLGYSGRAKLQKNYLLTNLWASSCPALPFQKLPEPCQNSSVWHAKPK